MLYEKIKERHKNTVFLDGDIVRRVLGDSLGYTKEDREKSALRTHNLCRMLDSQNINVVCCILSNQIDIREMNRNLFEQYFEIYVDVSKETLIKRDPKGLYAGYLKGDVKDIVGMDIDFLPPGNSDMRIDNNEFVDLSVLTDAILEQLPIIDQS